MKTYAPAQPLREVPPPKDWYKAKILTALVLLTLAFLAVVARLFVIQIVRGDELRARAARQYMSRIELVANRGEIRDASGNVLATTLRKRSIAVDPTIVENPARICSELSKITGVPASSYMAKIKGSSSSFVWLERAINAFDSTPLDTLDDKGLIRIDEPRRHFPHHHLASQSIGFADIDGRGVAGLELALDTVLRGKNGYRIMMRDGRGRKRPVPDQVGEEPLNGAAVELTLDLRFQSVIELELARGVLEAQAESGTVVAIHPATGAILGIASYPTFDPNQMGDVTAEAIRNRAITDMYEPGSTFKLVTAAALLEDALVLPADTIDCMNGQWDAGDHVIRDDHPLARASFAQAMEQSSNIAMAKLSERMPNDRFYKYVRDFGFGIYLGIDVPGEVRGVVKKPKEFDGTTKRFMAFGYQLGATALQIANAYAAVANKGVMMRPYIVQAVERNGEKEEVSPQRVRRVVSEQTAETLTEMLVGVVERGTGRGAAIPGIAIAGKTGTAQQLVDGKYSRSDYTATFAGFFPAQSPQVAMVVMLNKPRNGFYGGQVSAPIFQRIARRLISSALIKVPQEVYEAQKQNIEADSLASLAVVPDLRGLSPQAAEQMAAAAGLRLVREHGAGPVLRQSIAPGTRIERGTDITVTPLSARDTTTRATDSPFGPLPDVRGMTLRRALAVLQSAGARPRVRGSGTVKQQSYERNAAGTIVCTLVCE